MSQLIQRLFAMTRDTVGERIWGIAGSRLRRYSLLASRATLSAQHLRISQTPTADINKVLQRLYYPTTKESDKRFVDIRGFRDVPGPIKTEEFVWGGEREPAYASQYRDHIMNKMMRLEGLKDAFVWTANGYRQLLSCSDERLWFNFSGTTDLVLEVRGKSDTKVSQEQHPSPKPAPRLSSRTLAVIQVKKNLQDKTVLQQYVNQSIAELLCADVQPGVDKIFAVLTDVTSVWHFFWLGETALQIESYRNTNEAMSRMADMLQRIKSKESEIVKVDDLFKPFPRWTDESTPLYQASFASQLLPEELDRREDADEIADVDDEEEKSTAT